MSLSKTEIAELKRAKALLEKPSLAARASAMLGAPLDTMTIVHYAEHLANIPHRIIRYEAPLLIDGRTEWRAFEEYDTSESPGEPGELPHDHIGQIVEAFLATGKGQRGTIGAAPSVLVPGREIVGFAVDWLESRLRWPEPPGCRAGTERL